MDNKILALVEKVNSFASTGNASLKKEIQNALVDLHASDQAMITSALEGETLNVYLSEFLTTFDPDFLIFLEKNEIDAVYESIGSEKLAHLITFLEIDDAVWLLGEIDNKAISGEIMAHVPAKLRIKIKRSLSYPEDSVGRNMNVDFLHVPYWWTVVRTMKYLKDRRKVNKNHNDAGEVFVIDESRKVLGTISILHLIEMEDSDVVEKILKRNIVSIRPQSMIEDIIKIFEQYELNIAPVVDKMERIIGVVELSDIADYIKDKSESDALHKAGVFNSKKDTIFSITKVRFIWLFINLITAIFASYFVSLFEDAFRTLAVLAVLLPITASMGGNCGTQSSTVITTNIANGRMAAKHVKSEVSVAALNGLMFGIISFVGVFAVYHNVLLATAFSLSIMLTIGLAGCFGAFIPIALHKLGFDPAVSATIFLTTLTDITGFLTFLWFAKVLLM